ncbi:MAG: hypothetical protein LBQ10_06290 [Desulfovibrio sp.]|jgi:hypothetical protein|nr:hypothetical protein [Desulfovibrio sp.]
MPLTDDQIAKLYDKHLRAAAGQVNPVAAAHAAWEQVQRDTEEWGRQLDKFDVSNRTRRMLTVGRTPDVLRKLGAPDVPMSITSDNLAKAMSDKEDHQLPTSLLKNLTAALAEPIMVFESATRADSFVVLTELRHDSRSVMVAMTLDIIQQRMHINEITSAYKKKTKLGISDKLRTGGFSTRTKRKASHGRGQTGYNCPRCADSQRDFL